MSRAVISFTYLPTDAHTRSFPELDGRGELHLFLDERYNGTWSRNKRSGLGEYLYANGDRYFGMRRYPSKSPPPYIASVYVVHTQKRFH